MIRKFFIHSKLSTLHAVPAREIIDMPVLPTLLCLSQSDSLLQQSLVQMLTVDGEQSVATSISQYEKCIQVHMLALLKHYSDNHPEDGLSLLARQATWSVLDSGSSRHLHPNVTLTDSENRVSLTGFDKSRQWTEGIGYLPITWVSRESGGTVAHGIDSVDRLTGVMHPILSMGRMLRDGFSFYLGGSGDTLDLYAVVPGGAYTIKIELGQDDILKIPHEIRVGEDSKHLLCLLYVPTAGQSNSVQGVTRTLKSINGELLHQLLNHSNPEKVFQTLKNTTCFKAIRLEYPTCTWCALGKSTRAGLSHQKHPTPRQPAEGNNTYVVSSGDHSYIIALNANEASAEEYEDGEHMENDTDGDITQDEFEYTAPTAGRALGEQPVPRYDLCKLRPFEVMFVDNKDYPCRVRGSGQIAFVLIDLKSQAKFKVDVTAKSHNGSAFQRIAVMNGVHKLPYHCRVWSDGCGSMVHVQDSAVKLGIDHAYTPPREPSLNEAEKVCNTMWAAARTHIALSKSPVTLFAECVSYSMYIDMRIATTLSREWKTPFELLKEIQPSLLKLQRWYTKSFVNIPKGKRSSLQAKGVYDRAEPGRMIGYHSPFSSVWKIMLSKNRLVHSYNVTFDPSDCVHISPAQAAAADSIGVKLQGKVAGTPQAAPEDDQDHLAQNEAGGGGDCDSDLPILPDARVNVEHCDLFNQFKDDALPDEYFEWTPERDGEWNTHADTPKPRPRPSYKANAARCNFLQSIADHCTSDGGDSCGLALLVSEYVDSSEKVDHEGVHLCCMHLALMAHKDMNWKEVLSTDDRKNALDALKKEQDSLYSTILERLHPGDEKYDEAVRLAVRGRYILDVKRPGVWKARGVKLGFLEDKLTADGPGFIYYAHVARMTTVRLLLSRPNRNTRRIAIKDVRTAFLQSHRFPPEIVKYMVFKHPETKELEYSRQRGPVYGEAGAPVRWENTLAPWLEDEGFTRG